MVSLDSAVVIYLAAILVCTEMCYLIAKKRHLPKARWMALGALFGPLAVLAALYAPVSGDENDNQ